MPNPVRSTLQGLFDSPSAPDQVAVVDPKGSLTYSEVADQVARLATLLVQAGVLAGDRVGIQLETSTRSMVAVHAVLHCGAVVVPLDPRAPDGHVAKIVQDCQIGVVITDASAKVLANRIDAAGFGAVIATAALDRANATLWDDLAKVEPLPVVPVEPDDVAYVIFTSGSTGLPKGITHTHRSGLAYARLAAETYDVGPGDRVAQAPALHFDQSTFGLYSAPLAGATALMIPEAMLMFPASAAAFVAEQGATIWYSVPTLIMRLVQRGGLETHDVSTLRWVKFGGEVFPPGEFAKAMHALAPARFSNVYGPAEVNQCTFFHLDAPPDDDAQIPIGRAWPETEIVLVDPERRIVTPGDEGEILVRSTTALQGYWGQPELTAASFCGVPELDADGAESQWYMTGDLAVERPDGELVFLGRADNQVKVRGHRIEIEAVETALIDTPGVAGAGVIVERGDDGATRLVAFVEGPAPIDQIATKRLLGAVLPAAAVPDEIRQLDVLPRTGTGKVNRNALQDL